MNSVDWNWFFSALAQSSAALVGIFAAFIISKLVTNNSKFNENHKRIHDLISYSQMLKIKIKNIETDIIEYNVQKLKIAGKELKKDIQFEHNIHNPEFYYSRYPFSKFMDKADVLYEIKFVIDEVKKEKEYGINITLNNEEENIQENDSTINYEPIQKILEEVTNHINKLETFYTSIYQNPEYSKINGIILILLAAMFIVGVIYPLSIMPFKGFEYLEVSIIAFYNTLFSLKGLLLCCITCLFLTIIVIFYFINAKMKYDQEKMETIRDNLDLKNYSIYFKYLIDNQ